MNSYERIYNILIEGQATGDSPTQTGLLVKRAEAKLKAQGKFTPQKQQQVADIGTRVASRQGRRAAGYWSNMARRSDLEGDTASEKGGGEYGFEANSRRAEKDRTKATIQSRRRYDAARRGGKDDIESRIKASEGKPRFGKDAFPT